MRIPGALLRQTVTVSAYLGETAVGPSYDIPEEIRARVEYRRRRVTRADGADVVAEATMVVRPGTVIPLESQVDVDDVVFRVVQAGDHQAHGGRAFTEILLGRGDGTL